MATEVKLPELGEGIESAEVVRVLVSVGETVTAEQALLEIETDKATVEVPAPAAGTVTEIAVTAGTTLAVGATILTLDSASATGSETAPDPTTSVAPAATTEAVPPAASSPAVVAPTPTSTSARPGSVSVGPRRETGRRRALAAPSVRKLAREIGVDIDTVSGTGTGDRVGIDDVKTHARQALTRSASRVTSPSRCVM